MIDGSWFVRQAADPDTWLRAQGVWVAWVGRATSRLQMISHVRPTVHVMVVVSGSGWGTVGGQDFVINAGEVFVLPAHRERAYGSGPQGWHVMWAALDGPNAVHAQTRWAAPTPVVGAGRGAAEMLERCVEEMRAQRPMHLALASQFAMSALTAAVAESARSQHPSRNRAEELVAAAQEHICGNLAEPLTLTSIAKHLHIGTEHLARVFRQATETTVMRYVENQRIGTAASLVTTTDQSIAGIAREVGLPDPAHFSRVFRRVTGTTPSQMRIGSRTCHSDSAR